MRDVEIRLVDDLIAVQNEIEIERPRRAGVRTRTAETMFDLEEPGEQCPGRKRRAARRGGVQEARLVAHAHRIGVMERRDVQVVDRGGQLRQRLAQVSFPIAQIAAKGDRNGSEETRFRLYSIQRVGSTAP